MSDVDVIFLVGGFSKKMLMGEWMRDGSGGGRAEDQVHLWHYERVKERKKLEVTCMRLLCVHSLT